MSSAASVKPQANSVFIITLRRGTLSEPESYYIPALTPQIAEHRVRRIAKADGAAILSIQNENGLLLPSDSSLHDHG
jgi:hypothetical protein